MIPTGKKLTKGRLFAFDEMKLTKADLWTDNRFIPEQVLVENYPEKMKLKTKTEDYYTKTFINQPWRKSENEIKRCCKINKEMLRFSI